MRPLRPVFISGTLALPPHELGFDELLEGFSEPCVIIGDDYRILAANRAYRETYTTGHGDVVGKTCHEISHHSAIPCDRHGEACPLQEAREGGHSARAFHIHHSADGRVFASVEVIPVIPGPAVPGGGSEGAPVYLERIISSPAGRPDPRSEGLVGESPAFVRMMATIHKVAPQMATVLLHGETGTGKELVSLAIHKLSPRSDRPFVAVDCSGLPENLIESELFGHEKGSFTGAHSRKTGLVEAATGGTLFLDEIGELPLSVQAKLLRLLETNVFRRVGGIEPLHANIRLISATHRDLLAMVREGSFRQDLYYRLNIFPVELPPLRERREDIPLLVASILSRLSSSRIAVSRGALALLKAHSYPGNVRELRNILERALILSDGHEITPDHLPDLADLAGLADRGGPSSLLPPSSSPSGAPRLVSLEEAERHYLSWALAQKGDDLPGLAKVLGVSLRTLYRKIADLKDLSGDSDR